jgi:hypothetical protein
MITFMISCFRHKNSGTGGHYYSIQDIAAAIDLKSEIVVVGDFVPKALAKHPHIRFVPSRWGDFRPLSEPLPYRPRLIHAFDNPSAVIGGALAAQLKIPLVVTKAGGPRLGFTKSLFRNMIVFHEADYVDLNKRILGPKKLRLIPNRVPTPSAVIPDLAAPFAETENHGLRVMAISRLASTYEGKINQAVNLYREIRNCGQAASLVIIGAIQCFQTYERLMALTKGDPNIRVLTSVEITTNASRYLHFADVVIGTGRGFIEGLALGKFMFFPVHNSHLPCFATPQNYQEAFAENFSPRIRQSPLADPKTCFAQFIEYATEGPSSAYHMWAKETFERDHSVLTGAHHIRALYNELTEPENPFFALLKGTKFYLLSIPNRLKQQATRAAM